MRARCVVREVAPGPGSHGSPSSITLHNHPDPRRPPDWLTYIISTFTIVSLALGGRSGEQRTALYHQRRLARAADAPADPAQVRARRPAAPLADEGRPAPLLGRGPRPPAPDQAPGGRPRHQCRRRGPGAATDRQP